MKIKPSPLVSSMSGRLNGGILRTQGNSVIVSRANQSKINAQVYRASDTTGLASKYSSYQANIAQVYNNWLALPQSNKDTWIARTGNAHDAYLLYMSRNINIASVQAGDVINAPLDIQMPQPINPILYIDTNGTGLEVFLTVDTPAGNPDHIKIIVYGTRNIPISRKVINKDYTWVTQSNAIGWNYDFGTAWGLSRLGIPKKGWRVFLKTFFISTVTGQKSLSIEVPTIVQSF